MERFQLQIGDVVNYKGIPVKIIGISSAGVDAVDEDNEGYILSVLDIEPIILDAGLLDKLGFRPYGKDKWVYLGRVYGIKVYREYCEKESGNISYDIEMYCDHEEQGCTDNRLCGVNYVHQLQQFIRLCWVGEHPSDGVYLRGESV